MLGTSVLEHRNRPETASSDCYSVETTSLLAVGGALVLTDDVAPWGEAGLHFLPPESQG